MYIRFVVPHIDGDSHQQLGIFQAVYDLRDEGRLYPYEEEHVEDLRQWFNRNLERPDRFTTSSQLHHDNKRAISWFKDSALEHISRIREIVAILENHGIGVQMITADRVGYVVYEDEFQIVAEAFSDMR